MSYRDDIAKLLEGFTESEKNELIERFGMNLFDPDSISRDRYKFMGTRKRIRDIENKAMRKLYPSKEIPVPGGMECTLCGITENEVKVMAKHNSGFSICNECVELCMQVVRGNK